MNKILNILRFLYIRYLFLDSLHLIISVFFLSFSHNEVYFLSWPSCCPTPLTLFLPTLFGKMGIFTLSPWPCVFPTKLVQCFKKFWETNLKLDSPQQTFHAIKLFFYIIKQNVPSYLTLSFTCCPAHCPLFLLVS